MDSEPERPAADGWEIAPAGPAADEWSHVFGGDESSLLDLVNHAVFLVDEADFTRFHAEVSEAAARWGEVGFQLEFTGPWPAYHFGGWDGL